MKTVNTLGGTITVNDTFEVRAPSGAFFDIDRAYSVARFTHPELETICLLNVRYVNAQGREVDWRDGYAETIWTFELPATDPVVAPDAVAAIIKQQIGFWALAEVGARGFMFDANSLHFDAKPKSRIVRVVITLDPSDTYTVRVVNRKTHEDIYRAEGIYANMLAGVIRTLAEVI